MSQEAKIKISQIAQAHLTELFKGFWPLAIISTIPLFILTWKVAEELFSQFLASSQKKTNIRHKVFQKLCHVFVTVTSSSPSTFSVEFKGDSVHVWTNTIIKTYKHCLIWKGFSMYGWLYWFLMWVSQRFCWYNQNIYTEVFKYMYCIFSMFEFYDRISCEIMICIASFSFAVTRNLWKPAKLDA